MNFGALGQDNGQVKDEVAAAGEREEPLELTSECADETEEDPIIDQLLSDEACEVCIWVSPMLHPVDNYLLIPMGLMM